MPNTMIPKVPVSFRTVLLLLFATTLLQACFYDNAQDYYVNFPGAGCDTTAVSFAAKVKPILDNNCATAGCHSGAFPAGNVDLTTVANAQTHADRIVFRTKQGTMPPSGAMNSCFVNTLEAWVNQGKAAN
jgi:hypothetical protein